MTDETRPTLGFDHVFMLHRKGPRIKSRYNVISELEVMLKVIDALSTGNAAFVHLLFCNSKAGVHHVTTRAVESAARTLAVELDIAFKAVAGGHNGIDVRDFDGEILVEVQPCWIDHPDWSQSIEADTTVH